MQKAAALIRNNEKQHNNRANIEAEDVRISKESTNSVFVLGLLIGKQFKILVATLLTNRYN